MGRQEEEAVIHQELAVEAAIRTTRDSRTTITITINRERAGTNIRSTRTIITMEKAITIMGKKETSMLYHLSFSVIQIFKNKISVRW